MNKWKMEKLLKISLNVKDIKVIYGKILHLEAKTVENTLFTCRKIFINKSAFICCKKMILKHILFTGNSRVTMYSRAGNNLLKIQFILRAK